MRANLIWLVVLLAVVGVAAGFYRFQTPAEPQAQHLLSLRLLLCNRPIQMANGQPLFVEGDHFRMALFRQASGTGQMSTSRSSNGTGYPGLLTTISAAEWAEFEKGLLALPGWREKECDGGEPEGQVLYTLLQIKTDQGEFVSSWRGLPKPQAEVANFLLSSRVGGPLGQGLAGLKPLQQGAQPPVGGGVAR